MKVLILDVVVINIIAVVVVVVGLVVKNKCELCCCLP